MLDAVDELIAHRRESCEISPKLKRAYEFHRANRQVLDFLVLEMRELRANGWRKVSVCSLWNYSRWVLTKRRVPGESFAMSNDHFPLFARIIAILHPDLNGLFEMNLCAADSDLGTTIEPEKNHPRAYVRRLTWADGTPLEDGWRPSTPHEPEPVRRRAHIIRLGY